MLNIIERPATHELYADDGNSLYGFDGAPYARPVNVGEWPVIGQAASVAAWIASPGDARTYYGAFTALVIYKDGRKEVCRLGDNISWLRSWIEDMQRTATVSVQWIAAYSDRNVARAQTKAVER